MRRFESDYDNLYMLISHKRAKNLEEKKMGDWINLFNGKNLNGWRSLIRKRRDDEIVDMISEEPIGWQVAGSVSLNSEDPRKFTIHPGEGILVNNQYEQAPNILTEITHGDCELHIEFAVPQGSNSGVYLMGKYEIQILDSWSRKEEKPSKFDCGAIYPRWINNKNVGGSPPRVNASRPPGEWQSFDVIFHAPKFDGEGNKISNAIFEQVVWNGIVVQENVEVDGPTRAAMIGPERPRGPLMLQGDHGPVAFRNIRMREI